MHGKISLDLVRNYDIICLEDLNIKGMVKNHRLSKAINDASWGQFVSMLSYNILATIPKVNNAIATVPANDPREKINAKIKA